MKTTNKIIKQEFNNLVAKFEQIIKNEKYEEVEELESIYSPVKSFYKKAFVYKIKYNNKEYKVLKSYDTIVLFTDYKLVYNISLNYSKTTTRHIKEFLNQQTNIVNISNCNNIKEIQKAVDLFNFRVLKIEELQDYYNLDFYYYQLASDEINILINSSLLDEYEEEEITEDYKNTFKNILNCLKIDFKNLYAYLHKNYYHNNLYNLTIEITR